MHITILSSSSNSNSVVRSHSYLIHPTHNKPNPYPCQLHGSTRASPTNIKVCLYPLLLTTLAITTSASLFALPNLTRDHSVTSQTHHSSKSFACYATADNFYPTSNINVPYLNTLTRLTTILINLKLQSMPPIRGDSRLSLCMPVQTLVRTLFL